MTRSLLAVLLGLVGLLNATTVFLEAAATLPVRSVPVVSAGACLLATLALVFWPRPPEPTEPPDPFWGV